MASLALVALLRMAAGGGVWSGIMAESATYSTLLGGREFQQWLGSRPEPSWRRFDIDSMPTGADATPPVQWERGDDTLIVTLDRPHVHNAFNRAMRDGLVEALQLAAVDESITRGAGPSFCGGGDLTEFGMVVDPPTAHAVRMTRHPAWWLHRLADRVVPHLHGACIGAGIELPAFASRVVAAPDTRISLPEVTMGLVPGAGGTVSVARRIGRQRCAWLALTGAVIDAPTANAWGLVDEIA
jgi:enoyl-CoA hydratase/carnithine racemase